MTYGRKEIQALIDRAVKAHDSQDSLRLTQAACNAANALITLHNAEAIDQTTQPSNA